MHALMKKWNMTHALVATGSETLSYGGGINGVGVLDGQSRVYLVFYGTQWGSSSTDSNGNLQFSSDSAGAAGVAQQMFRGIGTNGERWSADLTQWCDGAGAFAGVTNCPASGAHYIPYQQGVLAGVWYDNTQASPAVASATQLGEEAVAAAAHFGNTTPASNRHTYYVILSPTGTNPDSYQGAYCAWHDYTADAGVTSPYGELAFSNQPYNIDSGAGCGVGFLNTPGTTDGYSITLGHEWHEMMSDQDPAGGWANHTGSSHNGQENSDECAWLAPGTPGGIANVTFATGTFAEQASWSNDTNSCAISHPIVTHATIGTAPVADFTYAVNGLDASFTDNSTVQSGTISHFWSFGDRTPLDTTANPSHTFLGAGTYAVSETVEDSNNNARMKLVTLRIVPPGGANQLIRNTGFENFNAGQTAGSPWVFSQPYLLNNSNAELSHGGQWDAWLGESGSSSTDSVSQQVTIPTGKTSATLQFALHIDTREVTQTRKFDIMNVNVYSTGGTLLGTVATYSNLDAASGYQEHTVSMAPWIGQTVVLKFSARNDGSLQTNFVVDDVTLQVQ
jgi:serine protease